MTPGNEFKHKAEIPKRFTRSFKPLSEEMKQRAMEKIQELAMGHITGKPLRKIQKSQENQNREIQANLRRKTMRDIPLRHQTKRNSLHIKGKALPKQFTWAPPGLRQ
jgi:uncharacterized protein YoaH (UPF0181 family)